MSPKLGPTSLQPASPHLFASSQACKPASHHLLESSQACFASFSRVPRPHNVGPADRPRASSVLGLSHQHSDPPVLSELPRAMEQWRPQMTSSRQAPGRQAPRRARRWTAPLSPDALPSVTVITFPEFCDPRGSSYAGSLGWGTHRPASHPPAASNDSTHRNHEHARSTCLPCLLFF